MIRLSELVTELVDAGYKLGDPNPRVVVRWYPEGGGAAITREIEIVFAGDGDGNDVVVLHVPNQPQFAGEPGAGDVVDESDVIVDVDLLLGFATGDRGCQCPDDRCLLAGAEYGHPECRERLKREMLERQRTGEQA